MHAFQSKQNLREWHNGCRHWLLPVLAVFLNLLRAAASVAAQGADDVQREADRFLRRCDSQNLEVRHRCESTQSAFVRAYLLARSGNYQGQRAVAFRLASTAPGSTMQEGITPDRIEACAWRTVIISSEHALATAEDEENERRDCAGLDQSEALAAELRAVELLVVIARSPAGRATRRAEDCRAGCVTVRALPGARDEGS